MMEEKAKPNNIEVHIKKVIQPQGIMACYDGFGSHRKYHNVI